MMPNLRLVCLCVVGAIWSTASAKTNYATPSASTPCPDEGVVPCFTLSQYALMVNSYFNASNNTLVLLPGNHSLDTDFDVSNVVSLTIIGDSSVSPNNTSVSCNLSAMFVFENVERLRISGIQFFGCVNNTVTAVEEFMLKDSTLDGQGRNGSGLELNLVSNATIMDSSFFSNTGDETVDPFHPWLTVIGGGAIHIINSSVSISNTYFDNNTADLGGAIFCEKGSIAIDNCTFTNNIASADGGGVYTAFSSAQINDTLFVNNSAAKSTAFGGAVEVLLDSSASIENCVFVNNSAGFGGGAIDTFETQHNHIRNTVFIHNTASIGSAIYVESTNLVSSGHLIISDNVANSSVVYILNSTVSLSGVNNISNNYGTVFAFASNLTFAGDTHIMSNSKAGSSQKIHQEGGAVTSFQSEIVFTGTSKLMYNTAKHGGAISATESKLYLYGDVCIAYNNASSSGGGIYVYQSELNFRGTANITGNTAMKNGGGIRVIGSTMRFIDGFLYFVGNRAVRGGGMCLELNAKLYVIKALSECIEGPKCSKRDPETWQRLEFTDNSADYGGALFVADETNSGTCDAIPFRAHSTTGECFFQALALHPFFEEELNILNTFFTNNTATVAGPSLYGGLLDRCTVSPFAEFFHVKKNMYNKLTPNSIDAVSYFLNLTTIEREELRHEVSSDPVRVCFCRNGDQPDCSYQPPSVIVRKGETFSVSLVAVDQVNNTLSNSSIHNTVSSQGGLGDGLSIKDTSESCTTLDYNILSPHLTENLTLHAGGPCKDTGISKRFLSVTFKSCPVGFQVSSSKTECVCDPVLYPDFVSNCSVDTESVRRKETVWISLLNTTNRKGYMIYQNCPFDYCHPATKDVQINLNTPSGADAQCAFNRTGKLCGSCEDGLSLSLGSSLCTSCSNNWLALLIVFAIAGVALVAFILVFNLTVAVGTINGLIFYANIIAANRAIFFPHYKPNVLTIFVAWLNLDFGFETCFFDGLDGYFKTWLQFVFPVYVLFLVAMVFITASYFPRFAKLLSNRNPVATLATLILLSYAKLVRTILAAVSFATLEYHTSDGEVNRVVVWRIDANIRYFQGKHIPLFITAIVVFFVGLTYTFILFVWQWRQHCPNRRCLRWLRNVKLNSFMDAYHAPYNRQHRYWTGLLLFVRALLYQVAVINIVSDPRNTLLWIACVVGSLFLLKELLKDRVYKSWPLNALESSFIFNLVIFATASLYVKETGGNQAAVAYTSTGIAFLTFLGILTYHAFANFKFLRQMLSSLRKQWRFRSWSEAQSLQGFVNQSAATTDLESERSGEFNQLREPLDIFDNDPSADDYYILEQSTYHPPDTNRSSQSVTHSVVDAIPTEGD